MAVPSISYLFMYPEAFFVFDFNYYLIFSRYLFRPDGGGHTLVLTRNIEAGYYPQHMTFASSKTTCKLSRMSDIHKASSEVESFLKIVMRAQSQKEKNNLMFVIFLQFLLTRLDTPIFSLAFPS